MKWLTICYILEMGWWNKGRVVDVNVSLNLIRSLNSMWQNPWPDPTGTGFSGVKISVPVSIPMTKTHIKPMGLPSPMQTTSTHSLWVQVLWVWVWVWENLTHWLQISNPKCAPGTKLSHWGLALCGKYCKAIGEDGGRWDWARYGWNWLVFCMCVCVRKEEGVVCTRHKKKLPAAGGLVLCGKLEKVVGKGGGNLIWGGYSWKGLCLCMHLHIHDEEGSRCTRHRTEP